MASKTILCGFAAPIPIGHRVEVTLFERTTVRTEGLFTETKHVTKAPAPYLPKIRDLDTGIHYVDVEHFELAPPGEGSIGRSLAMLADHPKPSTVLTPTETIHGRVMECQLVASVTVYADDLRTHTRLVLELDPAGYRG